MQREVGVERSLNCAGGFADEFDVVEQRLVASHDRPAECGRVPIDVLSGRIHGDVCAQIKRALNRRGEESVVNNEPDLAGFCEGGDRANVGELQRGICRSFDEDQAGVGLNSLLDVAGVAGINEGAGDPKRRENLLKEPDSAAVDRAAANGVIAVLEQCEKKSGFGRETSRKADRGQSAFQATRAASRASTVGLETRE